MSTVVRVLHLDDNPQDAELVALALEAQKKEFPVSIQYVRNREEFFVALERRDFDIILSDYRMPGFDGEQALRLAREQCPEIPFIMVTGELGEERVIETMKRGATDYVLKDRIFRLIPAIQRALAEAEVERKRHEALEALRENEQRLRATFNNAALGIVEADIDGRFLVVNDRLCSILGYAREELLQMTVHELTAPEDRKMSDTLNSRLVAGEAESLDYEKRYLRRDGSRLWVHMTVSVMRDATGKMIRLIGTMEDISERKQTEERVADLARFPDENPAPVIRVRADGKILYSNAASGSLLKSWLAGTPKRIDKTLRQEIRRAMKERTSRTIDLAIAGSVYTVLVVPVPERGYVNLYGMDVTEQRRLEEALIEAMHVAERRAREAEAGKQILDALMENIPEGITIASAPDVITVRTSRYAEELLMKGWHRSEGLSMEEWLARVDHFLADGNTPARVEDLPLWRAVKLGEHVVGEEMVLRRPDGERFSVLCTAGPIRDTEGRITGAVVAWRDISDRKQTEFALLESENRYRSIFENSHAVMLILDPDTGRIVDANPAAEEYYGWTRRELRSMSVQQITTHSPEEVAAQMLEAKEARRKHFVFRHRRARGDVRDVEVHTGPVEIHGRRLLHSIIHDVSERRLAEERLEWHLENSPLAVVEWDREYKVARWSREAARLFGYSREEMIGRRIEDLHLVVPEDIAVVERTMTRLSSGQERTVVSENRNVTRDGRIIHCVWHNSVLTDPAGKMSSVMSLVQDVTAERSVNASLQKTIASLQVLVTSSNEHMILLDSEGTVLCSSRRAAATLGYGSKEIEGKTWQAFVPEEQMIHARFFYRDLLRDLTGRIMAALTLVTATGEKALFSINASRVSLGVSFGYLLRVERVSTNGTPEIARTEGIPVREPSGGSKHGG